MRGDLYPEKQQAPPRRRPFLKRVSAGLKAFTMRFSQPSPFLAFLPRTEFNYAREVGRGTRSSTVMAPVWWLMRTFPEAPVQVARKDGEEREVIPDHPMTQMVARPNEFYSGHVLWMATVMDLALSGNGYWLLPRDRDTLAPTAIWWVPSFLIRPRTLEGGEDFISFYEYRPGTSATINLDRNDVVHFRYGLDPEDNRLGLSPLQSLFREIFTDDEAANFTASLLRNNGMPTVAISPTTEVAMSDDDQRAIKHDWMAKTTGDRRGEPLISDRPFDLKQFGFNPQQMDLKLLRRVPEERVSGVIGVAAIVAGLGAGLDRSTFANMAEAREMSYESAVIPLQRLCSSDLITQLLPHFEGNPERFWVGFDLSEVRVLQEDENKKVERLTKELTSGAITVAEYRRETGREPGPADEIYLRPVSLVEVPAGQLRPSPAEAAGRDSSGQKGSARQDRFIRQMDRETERLSDLFASELDVRFQSIGERAAAVVTQRELDFTDEKRRNGDGMKQFEEAEIDAIMGSMDLDAVRAEEFQPVYERHYSRVGQAVVDQTNSATGLEIGMPDTVARQVFNMGGSRTGLLDLTGDTRLALLDALSQASEEGLGTDEIARRIRDRVPSGRYRNAGSAYRARLIARTETRYAQNFSTLSLYRESDVLEGVRAYDGNTDLDCAMRDQELFTFSEAQTEMDREHPNGTLSFAPVTREEWNAERA